MSGYVGSLFRSDLSDVRLTEQYQCKGLFAQDACWSGNTYALYDALDLELANFDSTARNCYRGLFGWNSGLKRARLAASGNAQDAYAYAFNNCFELRWLETGLSAWEWVQSCSNIFYNWQDHPAILVDEYQITGLPDGMVWRDKPYLTFFKADYDGAEVTLYGGGGWSGQYSTGGDWEDYSGEGVSTGDGFVQFRGTSGKPSSEDDPGNVSIEGSEVECYGNVWTLCGDDVEDYGYAFYALFDGQYNLVMPPSLDSDSGTLYQGVFKYMFNGSGLRYTPQIDCLCGHDACE